MAVTQISGIHIAEAKLMVMRRFHAAQGSQAERAAGRHPLVNTDRVYGAQWRESSARRGS